MVTGKLKLFSIYVYSLFDPGFILLFVTPLVAKNFEIFTGILHERFIVSTTVGELVFPRTIHKNCPIMLLNRVFYVNLVEHNMFEFDIILGICWFHACFASFDCRTRVVRVKFPNEPAFD